MQENGLNKFRTTLCVCRLYLNIYILTLKIEILKFAPFILHCEILINMDEKPTFKNTTNKFKFGSKPTLRELWKKKGIIIS